MDYEFKLIFQQQNQLLDILTKKVEDIEKKIIPAEKLLDSTEVMKLLGVSERTLATYRKSGIIEYVKIGGAIRYPQTSLNNINKIKLNHRKDDFLS